MTNHQSNFDFKDFPVGTKVKIICDYQDGYFWNGETGVVESNNGKYLGIVVKLDKPRFFKVDKYTQYVQYKYGFNPTDLELLENKPMEVLEIPAMKEAVGMARKMINESDSKIQGESKKSCLCHRPCDNGNCPKEEDAVCCVNHCDVLREHVMLISNKKYCSECGRKLR